MTEGACGLSPANVCIAVCCPFVVRVISCDGGRRVHTVCLAEVAFPSARPSLYFFKGVCTSVPRSFPLHWMHCGGGPPAAALTRGAGGALCLDPRNAFGVRFTPERHARKHSVSKTPHRNFFRDTASVCAWCLLVLAPPDKPQNKRNPRGLRPLDAPVGTSTSAD